MKKLIVICLTLVVSWISILGPSITAGTTNSPKGKAIDGPLLAPLSAITRSLPTGEFPICTDPASQGAPAIWGDIVVWIDERNGNHDIYGYDLSTQREFRITNDTARPSTLDIGDRVVVWYDWRADNQGVYGYDLSTEREFLISIHSSGLHAGPTISGDIVVWTATSPAISRQDIRGFDLSTQSSFVIPDVWWGYSYNPDIFGNIIVWENGLSNPTRRDIHGFD
ncbi:MAG: hypothetical protein WBW48_14170, partial [Anaerolineae bacterium]